VFLFFDFGLLKAVPLVNVQTMKMLLDVDDRHNNRARRVLRSSPDRRLGSTLNEAPSNSPTSSSFFDLAAEPELCVPPVSLSVFSGTESVGTKFASTLEIISGGGLSLPILGISFAIVEVVFVM